jgi:formylglycine-generating enzyme required for sulfatase activity
MFKPSALATIFLSAALLSSCNLSIPPGHQSPSAAHWQDLEQEYAAFHTQALTANYLGRKIEHWVRQQNGEGMRREMEFARLKHPILLQTIMPHSRVCSLAIDFPEVRAYQSQSPSFASFIDTFNCTPASDFAGSNISNSVSMHFKGIAAGTFMMGSPQTEIGRNAAETQHPVTLTRNFYLQTTEVTQAQWWSVMGSWPQGSPPTPSGDHYPMSNLLWEDIQVFIATLNNMGDGTYRLPTEAEWEYAARAGTTGAYACATEGDSESCLNSLGWYTTNSSGALQPVATKTANPWGLYDMHGNVMEWVQDWYGDYASTHIFDPQGPTTGTHRAVRGGSAGSRQGSLAATRSATRLITLGGGRVGLGGRYGEVGFRLVREP